MTYALGEGTWLLCPLELLLGVNSDLPVYLARGFQEQNRVM